MNLPIRAVKHWLVYADGRVEESKEPLVGDRWHKVELNPVDGSFWERVFQVEMAHDENKSFGESPITMVALECLFAPLPARCRRCNRFADDPIHKAHEATR